MHSNSHSLPVNTHSLQGSAPLTLSIPYYVTHSLITRTRAPARLHPLTFNRTHFGTHICTRTHTCAHTPSCAHAHTHLHTLTICGNMSCNTQRTLRLHTGIAHARAHTPQDDTVFLCECRNPRCQQVTSTEGDLILNNSRIIRLAQ